MRTDDIRRMAHDIIDRCAVENDQIEYKKSASDAVKDGILKTACAFANNYMNREIGLLFIWRYRPHWRRRDVREGSDQG